MNRTAVIFMKFQLVWLLKTATVVIAALNLLTPFPLAAADPLQLKLNIAMVLAEPSKFSNQVISLEGTVQFPKLVDNFSPTPSKKLCSQYFELADDTGSIATAVAIYCDEGKQNGLILAHGDRVVVSGTLVFNTRDFTGNLVKLRLMGTKFSRP